MSLRVIPEHLATSALQVDGQAEEMLVGYASTHGRIDAAQVGWVGRSAPALAAKLTEWQATVATLQAQVAEHGVDFHSSAERYATTDTENAQTLNAASQAIEDLARSQGL